MLSENNTNRERVFAAVNALGPISPAVVMYTVARQGQRGFHQITEYNKRILIISNADKDGENSITPTGGFKHFGLVRGDYIIVRGSVLGCLNGY